MVMEKSTKKGIQEVSLLDGFWREGGKVRNVHRGSCRTRSREVDKQKAMKMKVKHLGPALMTSVIVIGLTIINFQ